MHRISKSHNNYISLLSFPFPHFFVLLNYNIIPSPATTYQGKISSLLQRHNHPNHQLMKTSVNLANLWQREAWHCGLATVQRDFSL